MYLILAKFRYDWIKIVDFLIKGHFGRVRIGLTRSVYAKKLLRLGENRAFKEKEISKRYFQKKILLNKTLG